MIIALGSSAALAAIGPFLSSKQFLRNWLVVLYPVGILAVFTVVFAVEANLGVYDKAIYTRELRAVAAGSLPDAFGVPLSTNHEPLYIVFLWLVGLVGTSTAWLYTCVSVVCLLAVVVAARLNLPQHAIPLFLLVTISLGVFTSYAGLVMRQGLSMAALAVAVAVVLRRGAWWQWASLLTIAVLFHWSCLPLGIVVAVIAVARIGLRPAIIAWLVAAALFVTGAQQTIVSPLATIVPELSDFTAESALERYTGGTNRLDFFLFSAAFLALGLVMRRLGHPPIWYDRLLVMYAALNVYFLLFGFIAFADRVAAYSWSLAPLIVVAPLVGKGSTGLAAIAVAVAASLIGFVLGPFASMLGLSPYP